MSPAPGWKKRARADKSFARKPGKQQARPLILIVCEDSVSSPGYFRDLKAHLRISTVDVEIRGKECGSAPINVVDDTISHKKKRENHGHSIDYAYCVVDVDHHASLAQARNKAEAHKLRFIVSSPCFELWYLVHFELGDRPHDRCDSVIAVLDNHLSGYDKGKSRPFALTWDKVDTAIRNARRLCGARADDPKRRSYTEVHEIVEELRALSKPMATPGGAGDDRAEGRTQDRASGSSPGGERDREEERREVRPSSEPINRTGRAR